MFNIKSYIFPTEFFFFNETLVLCSPDVNYEELARCTDDFNGAQCKAVCVEAVSRFGQFPLEICFCFFS